MEIWHVVLLALIQALSEFLPISSSGHLWLTSYLLGWPYQGLMFDLALHLGTLAAVVIYFRRDLIGLLRALLALRPGRALTPEQRLGIALFLGTLPAALVGVMLDDATTEALRHPLSIASNLIVFGLLLLLADRKGRANLGERDLSLRDAVLIGAAQALALVPGVSRSGITLTAGLMLGLTRTAAARFSFLLSVPITFLATGHGAWQVVQGNSQLPWSTFALGAVVAAVAGLACIHFLLAVLRRISTVPFVVYRVLLGIAVIAIYCFS